MVELEYGNTKINVPESWNDITLAVYEEIYTAKPGTPRERVEVIAKICSVEAEVLLAWPAEIFNTIVGYSMFLYEDNPYPPTTICTIDGINFVVPIEDELTLGEYVDADEAHKAGTSPISATLAIVCRPAGETYDPKKTDDRQRLFAAQPMSNVMGVMAFFLHSKIALELHTQVFGKLRQAVDLLPRSTALLRSLGAGIKLSRILQVVKYWYLIKLLRSRLHRLSPSYNTVKTKNAPKLRNVS